MCGRYSLAVDTQQLRLHFDVDIATTDWLPTYSVAPSTPVPIVRERTNERGLTTAVWGFRPKWAKADGPRPINARLETIATNGLFKDAFVSQRCLIPMTGYIEWVPAVDSSGQSFKQPVAIATPNQHILAAAGLWAAYRDTPDDPWQVTCTVITREAVDASGDVHDRMPVVVPPPLWDWWLDPKRPGQPIDCKELSHGSDTVAKQLMAWPISRRINHVRTIDPTDQSLLDLVR
ncbi:SOS response-associated peptidase [Stomatohabitans albus]|uniref:SOS response-associated peptidase n=1 Tax=Stomatohabitans albus TaxID=3110766 RepID=UPI00300D746C